MKTIILNTIILLMLTVSGKAQFQDDDDRTESPYFQVKSTGESFELPLQNTSIEVNIVGVIADVTVHQTYENKGKVPVEAIYVFPGSTRSAVYGMTMKIADRVIVAEVQEKQKAQETFDQAKKEGKTASLLQQHRPNVFQMNVANIGAGETVEVTLQYTELLVPDEGIYEFVYPTTVGPRYTDMEGTVKNEWVLNPFANEIKESFRPKFNINIELSAALPLHQVKSTSHAIDIKYKNHREASVTLQKPSTKHGDKDYILHYSLLEKQIQTGITLYEGEEENFFLFMMQPPKIAPPKEIVPKEYIFIVDVSGSMNGFPLEITKNLMKDLLTHLHPGDKFNILLFAASSQVLSDAPIEASDTNIKKAINFIDQQRGSGGTELLPALKEALATPKEDGYSRNIIIATDGFVTVEREAFDLIRNKLGDTNFFPFGIGTNINRYLIEGMSRVAQTTPLIVTSTEEARNNAEKFRKYISSPLLTDIKVKFKGLDVYDVEPKSYPDLFAEKPLMIYGKWKGSAQGKVEVKGTTANAPFNSVTKVTHKQIADNGEALKYLWARNKVMALSDYNSLSSARKEQEQITKLGLKYNLLTEYTSFVGVDEQDPIQIVSAPSSSSGAVPEPHEWAMITMVLLFVGFLAIKKYV